MSNRFDLLTQQLFQKNISDCSVEELQNLAGQFPYFAPAQYVLLKKLEQINSDAQTSQLQKAVLYYHNPAGFHQFINEEITSIDVVETDVLPEPDISLPDDFETTEETDAAELPEELLEETPDAPALTVNMPEQLTAPVPAIEENAPAADVNASEDTVLAFEPYHTVDYFASQGIKLSQEEATKDRFGRQLKSFTEWLKTMKKIPLAEQAKPIDAVAEQKVENLAAHSVEESDVLTEAMAEVWVKQGKMEKAMEVYNKLSLLNPSKRAYFAAKVEFLKKEI